ncbi:alkaline phosphatase D family protein [Nakamurella sp.]|uniref:alkaline phosphatase D family protein n=1 Tax=Nakamurella sp. TaxID=1869182 RepID=UPI003783937D
MTQLLLGPLLRHVGPTDATIWVETDSPCEVRILGASERTWTVRGHHYALVPITGLDAGTSTQYQVELDGERVWPPADDDRPAPRIRTVAADRPVSIAFGSCRYASSSAVDDPRYDADALASLARQLVARPEEQWPQALLMLGDQVYADETSAGTQEKIRRRRDITEGAKEQVADFEEYTWLYHESWTDPDVRWLLSTVPTSMIFDDHDVRDDWNTSQSWRRDMAELPWWRERIVGALTSYWVYQHLGNLGPAELAESELYQRVRTAGGDVEPLLREFAVAADAEADGAKGARWSYRRDFGPVRLLVIDSRCGRVLDGTRGMIGNAEFDWITDQLGGDYRHLLIGTSLPWLLAPALHDIEAWNEALCAGRRGRLVARWSEGLRRAADLEHWAAFGRSFERLSGLIAAVGRGEYGGAGGAPSTICVLSGDVHHAYIAAASMAGGTESAVYQLTCSPLHNRVPAAMKLAFRAGWSSVAEHSVRVLIGTVARIPRPQTRWHRLAGPLFGNDVMSLTLDGPRAQVRLDQAGPDADRPELHEVTRLRLA